MAGMYSPPPKRRATSAPRTPTTPSSSNSTQKQSLSGYIVAKGVPITNHRGNKICTVKLQTDANKYTNIKVMMFDDVPDDFQTYLGEPITLENIIKFNDSGSYLFNPRNGPLIEQRKTPLSFKRKFLLTELDTIKVVTAQTINVKGALQWDTPIKTTRDEYVLREGKLKTSENEVVLIGKILILNVRLKPILPDCFIQIRWFICVIIFYYNTNIISRKCGENHYVTRETQRKVSCCLYIYIYRRRK